MTVDRYTKAVLTVIAIRLIWISIRPVVMPAYANQIRREVTDVDIAAIAGQTLRDPAAVLPVNVMSR